MLAELLGWARATTIRASSCRTFFSACQYRLFFCCQCASLCSLPSRVKSSFFRPQIRMMCGCSAVQKDQDRPFHRQLVAPCRVGREVNGSDYAPLLLHSLCTRGDTFHYSSSYCYTAPRCLPFKQDRLSVVPVMPELFPHVIDGNAMKFSLSAFFHGGTMTALPILTSPSSKGAWLYTIDQVALGQQGQGSFRVSREDSRPLPASLDRTFVLRVGAQSQSREVFADVPSYRSACTVFVDQSI